MKAKDIKEVSYIKPAKEGVKVFLAKLPEFVEAEKGNQLKFNFVDKDGAVFNTTLFDPFTPSEKIPQSIVEANFSQMFWLLEAFVPVEAQEQFGEIDFQSLKEMNATFNKMVAPDWANTEATLIIGYDKGTGYTSLPLFGRSISTKYSERPLEFPISRGVNGIQLEPVTNPTRGKGAAGASAKPDTEDDDEV